VRQSVTLVEDKVHAITLVGKDVEGSTLTYTVSIPTKGVLSGTLPNLIYTPNANANGEDSFTFKVNDGFVDSAVATVSINITAVNDAPVAVSQSVTLDEDDVQAITLVGTDVEGDALSFTIVTQPAKGTLSGTPPNLVYTPNANLSGSDSFAFRVRDGVNDSVIAIVSIAITSVNDEPVALAQSVTVTEDTTKKIVLRGTDSEGAKLTFKVVSQPTKGVISGTGANISYTPNANATGSDSFTFNVNDGAVDSSTATVSVNIVAVNDAPVAVSQAVTTDEDKAIAITLLGSDAESSTLSYTLLTVPTKGTLSGSAPNLTYTPNSNVSGSDLFTFKVNDGTVDSTSVATVSIIIAAVNDIPVALAQSLSTTKNTARSILLSATDVENQSLTYTVVSRPTHGTLLGTGSAQTYTPESNYVGADSLTYKASDPTADSAVVTVNIKVTTSNVAPVALVQSASTAEDTTKIIVLAATDADNDSLTYTIVSNPTKGTLIGTPPNLTYLPNTNAVGSDTFTFKANDGAEDSILATVTVTVTPVNDAPAANASTVSGSEDSVITVTLNVVDPDGDQLTYTVFTQPSHGTLGGTPPALTYTPEANFSGSDSIQFKVSDGAAESSIATVTLAVNPVNDLPTLNALAKAILDSGKGLSFTATGSDIDLPAQSLTFSLKSGPDGMTVSKQGDVYWLPKGSQRPSTNTVVLQLSDGAGSVDRSFVVEASEAKQSARFAGAAIDGYIAGATLWFDADLDGVLDPEEPRTVTDREGNFDLDFDSTLFDRNNNGQLDPSEGRLVVEGGVDLSSGQPRVGQLTAPAGSEVITPLTTMVDLVSRQGVGMTTAAAEERVRTALGIPAGISVTSYDPVAAAIQGDTRAATVQVAASSVADTIGLLANVVDGASTSVSANQSVTAVSQALASKLASGAAVDLNSTTTLSSTLTAAASSTGSTLSAEVTAIVSQVVSEQNTAKTDAVANSWNPLDALRSISQVQAVSQSDTSSALNDLGAGLVSTDDVQLLYTGSALTDAISAAPIGDVTGTDRRPGTFDITTVGAVVSESGRSVQPLIVARKNGSYGAVRLQLLLDGDSDLLISNVVTVEFADAVTQQTVDFAALLRDDTDPQTDRIITANLRLAQNSPAGAIVGSQNTTSIRVVDNDSAGSIGFVASRTRGTEGDQVTVELQRLDGTAGRVVAVVRLYGGTALPGQDYPNSVITTEFLSGQSRKVVNLGWIDDGNAEPMESVNAVVEIGAGSAPGAALVSGATETVIDVDDKFVQPLVNTRPLATGVSVGTVLTVIEGSSISLTLQGQDAEGATLSFISTAAPSKGVLSGRAPNLTYRANLGAKGVDTFTYKVNDGQFDSAIATVSLLIKPINLAPEGYSQILTTEEDRPVSLRLTGTDPDGDSLTYRVVTLPVKGRLSGVEPNLVYTPNPNANGIDSFQFRSNDSKEESPAQTIWVVIQPANDQPISQAQSVTVLEDGSASIQLVGIDPDGLSLSYAIVEQPSKGVLTGVGANLTYRPNLNINGSDRFTFRVNDGTSWSTESVVTISISPVNDSPEAIAQSISAVVQVPTAIKLSGTDIESDLLTYTVLRGPTQGILTGALPNLIYTAAKGALGGDSFTFRVNDGSLDSTDKTISIQLVPENLAPVAATQNILLIEDSIKAIALSGQDPENAVLIYTVVSSPSKGVLSGVAPNLIYTHSTNANGVDSFTFKVNDGSSDSAIASVNLTISPVNDAPIASPETLNSTNRASVVIQLKANDIDSSALTYSVVRGPTLGSLSGQAPNLVYTPRTNVLGNDTFTFVANDGNVDSEPAEVTIRVSGTATIPVALVQNVATEEDVPLAIMLKGTDSSGLPLTYVVDMLPASGTLSGTAPDLVYTPKPGFNGRDTIGFRVFNGARYSSSALVQIRIDASQRTSLKLIAPAKDAKQFELDVRAGNGVKVVVDSSTDLNQWSEVISTAGKGNSVTVSVKVPIDSNAKSQFWRVRRR
jgi:hypothetical protein